MEKCDACKRMFERQRIDDLSKGVTWLSPEHVWICEGCLRYKIKGILPATE